VLKQWSSIVIRIIDTIKMLGKQAVPFRGHRHESAYTLGKEVLNHGSYLATVQLMAKCDPMTPCAGEISAWAAWREIEDTRNILCRDRGIGILSHIAVSCVQ
jgi:hypothetical protein